MFHRDPNNESYSIWAIYEAPVDQPNLTSWSEIRQVILVCVIFIVLPLLVTLI